MFFNGKKRRGKIISLTDSCGFAGLHLDGGCRRLETSLLAFSDFSPGAEVILVKSLSYRLPDEIPDSFERLRTRFKKDALRLPKGTGNGVDSGASADADHFTPIYAGPEIFREIDSLCFLLTTVFEEAIGNLVEKSGIAEESLAIVSVNDPGLWFESEWGIRYASLCDAEILAERSGFSILHSFPSRDIAAGGSGGPILPLAESVFLSSPESDRLLLDLGQTIRLTFFPKSSDSTTGGTIFPPPESFDIDYQELIPGASLLDAVIRRASGGKKKTDSGGRFSVRGVEIPELSKKLRKLASTLRKQSDGEGWAFFSPNPLPIEPYQAVLEPYWDDAASPAKKKQRAADLLQTLCRWSADEVVRAVSCFQKRSGKKLELIATGSLLKNPAFLQGFEALEKSGPVLRFFDLGLTDGAFGAVATALLGLFFINRTSATIPRLTDAEHPAILGRLIPGQISPTNIRPFREVIEKW